MTRKAEDNFIKSRGLQRDTAIARRQALLAHIGDKCLNAKQIAAWFITVSHEPLWQGLMRIDSVLARAVTAGDLYCQRRHLKKGGHVGHYQRSPHNDQPPEHEEYNPFDYGKEVSLMMGYAHIQPKTKGRRYMGDDAVPSMPAQSCGRGYGIQSGMNSVYYGG